MKSLPSWVWFVVAGLYSILAIVFKLESNMQFNILVGYPLITICGYGFANREQFIRRRSNTIFNYGGATGILIASFTLFFWMIPQWMDQAVSDWFIAIFKHLSLFFLVGFALAVSVPKANFIFRGFVKIEFITMLLRLGWIYMISPVRLCNNYLLSEQATTGKTLLIVAFILSVVWLYPLFIPKQPANKAYNAMNAK